MTSPPADGLLADVGGTLTNANAKTALEQVRDVLTELPGGAAEAELTISGGSITPTGFFHTVDTEGDAASDDLTNIQTTNHPLGRMLLLRAKNAARTVVIKDSAGGVTQIATADGEDFEMDDICHYLWLIRLGNRWQEIERFYGWDASGKRTFLGLGTAATKNTGVAAGNVVEMAAGPKLPAVDGSALTGIQHRGDYILLQDQKASGTGGGGFVAGAWQVRTINTEVIDEGGDCALAANQITLAEGTYYCKIFCPALEVSQHKARLHETTSTLADIIGTNSYGHTATDTTTYSIITGKFTISAAHVAANQNIFEVQHRCTNHNVIDGYGKPCTYGVVEVYTSAEFWRID